VVLDIYNITIHPNFAQGQAGWIKKDEL
jgi:hypothetical protein